jgi:hypothetical protein
MPTLSKSRFVSGNQCEKKLYFDLFRRDLKPEITEEQQALVSQEYISTLKFIDKIENAFLDLVQINYTPNFITFTCKFPKGRSKTFFFIRFKKNNVQFELSGQSLVLSQAEDFTSELMDKLNSAFNNLSEKQI